eukprot:10906680-Lingulodinium_polyedra.AAC.1
MQRRQLEEAPEGVVRRTHSNVDRAFRAGPNALHGAAERRRRFGAFSRRRDLGHAAAALAE